MNDELIGQDKHFKRRTPIKTREGKTMASAAAADFAQSTPVSVLQNVLGQTAKGSKFVVFY